MKAVDLCDNQGINEIKIANMLKHDNIVELRGSFQSSEFNYLIFEFCEKGSLYNNLIELKGPQNEIKVIGYIKQIVDGLAYMHSKRIVHRDIKLANIFLTKNDVIKIGDFGCSVHVLPNMKLKYAKIGTLGYLAPEARLEDEHSFEIDIWSLGLVFYELLLGETYGFNKPTPLKEDPRVYIEDAIIDEKWKGLILEMLNEDREKRPTIFEIQQRLKTGTPAPKSMRYGKKPKGI